MTDFMVWFSGAEVNHSLRLGSLIFGTVILAWLAPAFRMRTAYDGLRLVIWGLTLGVVVFQFRAIVLGLAPAVGPYANLALVVINISLVGALAVHASQGGHPRATLSSVGALILVVLMMGAFG